MTTRRMTILVDQVDWCQADSLLDHTCDLHIGLCTLVLNYWIFILLFFLKRPPATIIWCIETTQELKIWKNDGKQFCIIYQLIVIFNFQNRQILCCLYDAVDAMRSRFQGHQLTSKKTLGEYTILLSLELDWSQDRARWSWSIRGNRPTRTKRR